jgi:hypothetical protein
MSWSHNPEGLETDAEHSELSNANTQSGLGSRTPPGTEAGTEAGTESVATKDIQQGEERTSVDSDSYSFPRDIKDIIATLLLTVDRIDSTFKQARDLILELARLLDERGLCERNQISRRIKKILEDKIQEGKITKEWVSECLPEDYKRKYTKSKSKLSLLSKQDKHKDIEPTTKQDQAELVAEQEPRLKQEVQVHTSGQEVVELGHTSEENPTKTQEVGGSGYNTDISPPQPKQAAKIGINISPDTSASTPSPSGASQQEETSPQPNIGIGSVGQLICEHCPTKDAKILELEQAVKNLKTIKSAFDDEVKYPVKQNKDLTDTGKKVLVSNISMPFEALRKDMEAVSRITKGIDKIFFKVSFDLERDIAEIEFCGITQQKGVHMTSNGKGRISKEA